MTKVRELTLTGWTGLSLLQILAMTASGEVLFPKLETLILRCIEFTPNIEPKALKCYWSGVACE